jgi:glycosyl transferase family 25
MKVLVINLPRSTGRKTHAQSEFAGLDVDFEFFPAIDGQQGAESFDAFDQRQYLINTGRHASPGEIGCYASHRALWQRCIDLNEPILVMEDDFKLEDNFVAALHSADALISDYGFIRLDVQTRSAETKIRDVGALTLYYYTKMEQCAVAYAINPRVAAALVAGSRVLNAPVDGFMTRPLEHGQSLFGLRPYAVNKNVSIDAGTIHGRDKAARGFGLKAVRLLTKTGWMISRARFNFKQRRRGYRAQSE